MNRPTAARRSRKRLRRTLWQSHMTAQRASGLTQAAYCREHQLNAKYFSLWKRKLRVLACDPPSTWSAESDHPNLIPVVLKNTKPMVPSRSSPVARQKQPYTAASLMFIVTLRNGIGIEVHLQLADMATVLSELARLPC